MLEAIVIAAVVALNVGFAVAVLIYAWRRLSEAQRRHGPGEDRRHVDAFYAERRRR